MLREILGRRTAAISLAAAALTLAGCGSTTTTPSSSAGVSASWAGDAKLTPATAPGRGPVSQVVWDLPYGEPDSLDPVTAYDLPDNTVLSNLCDSLVRINANLQIVPGLATWTQPNAGTLIFNLRPGVKFWNGQPLTANDVVYNLDRQVNPKNDSDYSGVTTFIKSVRQTGPAQVTVKTDPPMQWLLGEMATGLGTIAEPSYIKAKGKAYGTPSGGVMCSGPFELKTWTPGQQMVLKRNPNYWDKQLEPMVNTLIFKFVTDPSAITNGLATGALNGTYEVPIQGVAQLDNSGVGRVYFGNDLTPESLIALQKTGPFSNPTVRMALSLALNREGIAKTLFEGYASPLTWPVGPPAFGYAPSVWLAGYKSQPLNTTPQIAAARALLARCKCAPTTPIVIAVQAGDYVDDSVALAIQSSAQAAGLKVQVHELQPSQYINLIFSATDKKGIDAYTGDNNYQDQADPMEIGVYNMLANSSANNDYYSNPAVGRLVYEAEATVNPTRRAELGTEAMKIYEQSLSQLPIVQYPERMFMSNNITGAPPDQPTFLSYPWAALIGAAK